MLRKAWDKPSTLLQTGHEWSSEAEGHPPALGTNLYLFQVTSWDIAMVL